jgi:hypothetical protein
MKWYLVLSIIIISLVLGYILYRYAVAGGKKGLKMLGVDNSKPGCRKCFLACGKAGKKSDPTRYMFCCDICRTFGYTDCDEHGCGNSSDGKGNTPNDPIGDFLGRIFDPTNWFAKPDKPMIGCDELTKGQLLAMFGRDQAFCAIYDRKPPGGCNLSDTDYNRLIKGVPVKHNYVYLQTDTRSGVESCEGRLTGGPVPNLVGRGPPNGPDGFVVNNAIGKGITPQAITDKYMDTTTGQMYGFRPVVEFIPGMGGVTPDCYLFYRKATDVLSTPPNDTGNSSMLDALFQAVSQHGQSGWTLTLSALDVNPYSITPNNGWISPIKVTSMIDNNFFNTIIPLDPGERPVPTFAGNLVRGQWAPIHVANEDSDASDDT